jgi:hypothetical protein
MRELVNTFHAERERSGIGGDDLFEFILFLVLDSGNRDVAVGKVPESCDVAA